MRKEQLIRICLAMLLASATLMLSSCKKDEDPKDKDPKVALVNTYWKMATDLPGLDIDESVGEVSGDLRFTSQTEGELTLATKGVKITFSLTYSYDAAQKAYLATVTAENETQEFVAKVNWDIKIMTVYQKVEGVVSPKPVMFFRYVK